MVADTVEEFRPAAPRSVRLKRHVEIGEAIDVCGRQMIRAPLKLLGRRVMKSRQRRELPIDVVAALAHVVCEVADFTV